MNVVNKINPEISVLISLFVHPMHFKVPIVLEFRFTISQAYSKDKNIPTANAMKKLVLAKPKPGVFITNSIEKLVQNIKKVYIKQKIVNCFFSRKTIIIDFLKSRIITDFSPFSKN